MRTFKTVLGYAGGVLTVLIALLVPFDLMGAFAGLVAKTGWRVDPIYTGGAVVRTIDRGVYKIEVYEPARPHWLQKNEAFVQVAFGPVSALPAHVQEAVDLDGDGQPDVLVSFDSRGGKDGLLRGEVMALNSRYVSARLASEDRFSRIVMRVGDRVIVRIPLGTALAR